MENIAVETTQNVNIEYPIAGIPERIAATLLDFLIMLGYVLIISVIFSFATVLSERRFGDMSAASITALIVLFLPVLFYSLIFETFMNGQSIGKRAVRIKVMRLDGRQPSFGNYVMRWILRLIDIRISFGLAAVVTIAINGKGQRLGDIAAGTMVIKMKHKEEISKTAFVNVQEDYVAAYPEVIRLTDREANIIKKVLLLGEDENRDEAQQRLVEKLSEHLSVQPKEENNKQFLKVLLKDYNKVNGRA